MDIEQIKNFSIITADLSNDQLKAISGLLKSVEGMSHEEVNRVINAINSIVNKAKLKAILSFKDKIITNATSVSL